MPELPEIMVLSRQMNAELAGKVFQSADIVQEKCLNLPKNEFVSLLDGKRVQRVYPKGKWVFGELDGGYHLLLNLNMGADILYYAPGNAWSQDYRARLHLADDSGFTCRFWWLGYLHLVPTAEVDGHRLAGGIAPSPLEDAFTLDYFRGLFAGGRGRVKAILMNQKLVGGIGNVYIQDILFRAGLHPLHAAKALSSEQVERLYRVTRENLQSSYDKGGAAYEMDFYGGHGGFGEADLPVGYKEGKPCPTCGTTIEKIKTGSNASYICPNCQRLPSNGA